MSDPQAPVDELLSAYLSGELDTAEAAALEDRLAADPGLAARLAATHEVLVALRDLDAVTPPPGYEQRLRERLAAARGAEGAAAEVVPLHRRRRRWAAVGGVAAGLVLLAGMAGALLTRGGDGAQVALPPAPAPAGEDEEFLERQTPGEEHAAQEAAGDQAGARAQGGLPLVIDDEAELPDDAAVRARFQGSGHGLLGTPRGQAQGLERSARQALRAAPALRSGGHPAACLDAVTAGASGPLVVARVDSVRYRGAAALAYVLVGTSPGADALDRTEAWIVDPRTCATRLFQSVD